MKEFEKWNIEHPIDSRYRDTPIKQFKAFIKEEQEKAWRAALEWAKMQSGEHEFDDLTVHSYIDMESVLKELG